MSALIALFAIKIMVTFPAVVISFLLFPAQRIADLTRFPVESVALFRLYGIAVMALLIAYATGIAQAQSGIFPTGIVIMGIVSNTGAATILLASGKGRVNRVFGIFYGAVALGFVVSLLAPTAAISPLL